MSAPDVVAAPATIQTDDGPMPAYVAVPDGSPKGGVVVIQEAFGVTGHIQDVTRRFAAAGWYALAPSLLHREGSPVLSYDDVEKAILIMSSLTASGITMDVRASLDSVESSGIARARTAIVGFCMGGTVAFYAATLRPVGAAVTFYGGGVSEGRFGLPSLVDLAPSLACPWLGLFGDLDKGIPVADVERLRDATDKAAPQTEIVRYPDAGHGFHCDARPGAYEPLAAQDAWRRTLEWLDRHAASE